MIRYVTRLQLGKILCGLALAASLLPALRATADDRSTSRSNHVRATMEFLASDALRGRGSATQDEWVAATYIASQLRQYGVEPAEATGGYLQRVELTRTELAAPPVLTAGDRRLAHGQEMLVVAMAAAAIAGPLQKIDARGEGPSLAPHRGAVVLLMPKTEEGAPSRNRQALDLIRKGAVAVLLEASPQAKARWTEMGGRLPDLPTRLRGSEEVAGLVDFTAVALNAEAFAQITQLADGTPMRLEAATREPIEETSWNVVGRLRGSDPARRGEAVLLSAHLDHVGMGAPVNGDSIYNGADDDASGVAAVLELARTLASGPRPKRTVIFALYGSEEKGGFGSTYFRANSPVALENIVANLQFEMIGRPDAAVAAKTLWLTGYERSNLGAALARHGARLVADPHPSEGFFERSDNYVLAKRGVVAHTVSSYGLHKEYHQPADDLAHIDLEHMTDAIQSMIRPVRWLANTYFRPRWVEGKQP